MVKSSCLAENFLAQQEIGNNVTIIRFSKEDVYEPMYEGEGEEAQPTGEMRKTDFVSYNEEAIHGEVTLDKVKAVRLKELEAYDKSDAVNEFFYQGQSMWIPREYRVLFQKRINDEKKWGNETVTLDYNDVPLTLNVEQADVLLDTIEHYATLCYDRTREHRHAIMALESVSDVLDYNITTGYPQKLSL